MDGLQFEHRCAELLRYRGFHKVAVTKGSGDQGVDILAQKNGIKYGIQCKYYSYPVGNKAIQEAYAGADFYDCDVAMVMTNSTFTRQARELADKLGVELWEHCSPNGSSSVISRLMRIFNLFFLTIGLCMCASARLLNFPEGTIRTYMNLLMLILASLSALLGWNHFLPLRLDMRCMQDSAIRNLSRSRVPASVHVRLSSFEYGLHSPRKTQGHFPHRL